MMQIFGDYRWEEYHSVFKIVLVFFILFGTFVLTYLKDQKERFISNDNGLVVAYVIFLILFIGTREYNIGTDTVNFKILTRAKNYFEIFTILKSDFLFEVLMSFSFWHQNFKIFLSMVAIVMNVSLYVFVRKFTDFGKKGSSLILFLTLASSFSFISIQTNILRNGLSLCFILLGIYSILEKDTKNFIIYMIIAYLFHRTAVIPIALILIVSFFNKIDIKYYLAFYGLAILLSVVGFGFHVIPFLSELGGEDFQKLSFSGDTSYKIGFRFDFVLYNTFFLILFLKFTNWNAVDSILIKYYILGSIVFFFNFYIPFSDRFGIYSWIIIPLLLFNTINEAFTEKKILISTWVLASFFIVNKVILFN